MIQRLAENLLIRVYSEISAVVSLDEQGGILGVSLFDSWFGGAWMRAEQHAASVWLMINHPEGSRELKECDLRNIAAFKEKTPFIPLRVFIVGEDIGIVEVVF